MDHTISSAWEQEGQRIAPALDFRSSALVIGADAIAAVEVALGIARAHARRRRVCVADVVGELRPIEDLLPADVEYGLMDAFFQGVSLNRVARAVDPAGNLLVMPSGPRPIDYDGILGSPRWAQLAAGFRDAGALLLVVAPPDAAGAAHAATALDGVVLVGDVAAPAGSFVLAHARVESMEPLAQPPAPVSDAGFDEELSGLSASGARGGAPASTVHVTPEMLETVQPAGAHAVPFWIGIAVAAVVAIGLAMWGADRYVPGARTGPSNAGASQPPAAESAAGQTALPNETAGANTAGTARMPENTLPPISASADVAAGTAVANPADSSEAAAFAVAIAEASNETSANVIIDAQAQRGLGALTLSPEQGQPASGPRLVVTGAFGQRASADSLLRALRRRGVLGSAQGHVTRLPLALLIQTGVARDRVDFFVHAYRLKGLPVYALVQSDGSANLYAGAFDVIDAAQPMLYTLRANGEQPRVAYRIGSAF
jgi:hypothetical protein